MLDTFIRVEDPMMIMVKPGKKQAIVEAMSTQGPSLEQARLRVLDIIKGR